MRNLLVFLPFGAPHVEEKTAILRSNIKTILRGYPSVWTRVTLKVAVYTSDLELPGDLVPEGVHLQTVCRKGVVGDLIKDLVSPTLLASEGHDYVLLLLDDVEILTQPDWKHILVVKKISGAHLVSPTLSHDSKIVYNYMQHVVGAPYTARSTSVMEFFMFLFDTTSYSKYYYPLLDSDNPWMWGIDLCLYYCGGVLPVQYNNWIVKHYYQGTCYQDSVRDARQDMVKYLEKRGCSPESLWAKRLVISLLNVEHLSSEQLSGVWDTLCASDSAL